MRLSLMVVVLQISSSLFGGPPPGTDPPETLQSLLETRVISASKAPQSLTEAPARVVIVTDEQIHLRGYMDLEELLHDLPGFDFNKNMGVEWSTIFMRGFRSANSDRFLLIWDGVIQNDLWKQSNWISRQYPLSNIHRVEVMYGPSSLLYGANAMSGIINVILKQDDKLPRVHTLLRGGAFWTRSVEAGFNTRTGEWGFHVLARSFQGDGFDLTGKYWVDNAGRRRYYDLDLVKDFARLEDPQNQVVLQDGRPTWIHRGERRFLEGGYRKSDRDGFLQMGLTYRGFRLDALGWRNEEGHGPWYTPTSLIQTPWSPTGNALRLSHEMEWSPTVSAKAYAQVRTSGLDGDTSYGLRTQVHLTNQPANPDELRIYKVEPTVFSKIFNRELRLGYQVNATQSPNLSAVVGSEFTLATLHEDYLRSADQVVWQDTPTHEERNFALFGNAQLRTNDMFSLAAGMRWDYNTHAGERGGFGSLTTSRVAGIFTPRPGRTWKLIYSQAFQAPPAFQKFSTVSRIRDLPSPDLKPERMQSTELGYGHALESQWRLDASVYLNQVDNFITTISVPYPANPSGTTTRYSNLGGVRILGAELDLRKEIQPGWMIHGNLCTTQAEDATTGRNVGDIAPWKANLSLDARLRLAFGVSLRGHYVSRRDTVNWDSSSIYTVRAVPGYFTLDATFTWYPPTPGLDIQLNVYNLFDRTYYDPGPRSADGKTYNAVILQQPLRVFLGLRYRFW